MNGFNTTTATATAVAHPKPIQVGLSFEINYQYPCPGSVDLGTRLLVRSARLSVCSPCYWPPYLHVQEKFLSFLAWKIWGNLPAVVHPLAWVPAMGGQMRIGSTWLDADAEA